MTYSSLSSIASNVADHYASRFDALTDLLSWENDADGNDPENYPGPGWDAETYVPDEADLAEYAARSRSLDGGCGVAELSPEERDLLIHSIDEDGYWDLVAESDSIHADRHADAPWA